MADAFHAVNAGLVVGAGLVHVLIDTAIGIGADDLDAATGFGGLLLDVFAGAGDRSPVPIPPTSASSLPSVSSQISGPVVR